MHVSEEKYPKEKEMQFSDLKGEILCKIERTADEEILFHAVDGSIYKMFHSQDCCEAVTVDDIVGDLEDLLHSPIITASEDTSTENPKAEYSESFTWTFYNIATIKGHVTIKWWGSSNGYYSESVSFEKTHVGDGFKKEPFLK